MPRIAHDYRKQDLKEGYCTECYEHSLAITKDGRCTDCAMTAEFFEDLKVDNQKKK